MRNLKFTKVHPKVRKSIPKGVPESEPKLLQLVGKYLRKNGVTKSVTKSVKVPRVVALKF